VVTKSPARKDGTVAQKVCSGLYQSRLRELVKLSVFCALDGEIPFSSSLPGAHCGAGRVL
jgi:hypothetical protein